MTETSLEQGSDTHIFLFSALGSLLLHALLVTGLAHMPQSIVEQDEHPTVQVNLVATPKAPQSTETVKPRQPRMLKSKALPLPKPLAQPTPTQPTVPPLPSLLAPTPAKQPPLIPHALSKPILQDTRASRALQSRSMLKMRAPMQTQHAAPSFPTTKTRPNPDTRIVAPQTTIKKERLAARTRTLSPSMTPPRILKATPPRAGAATVTRPTIITSSRPTYPRVARESGWEGTVIVRTLIDANGQPSQVKIRKSCGHLTLDQAALDAIQRWKFQPAKDGNIPIAKWVDIPIKFDLNT